MEPSLTDNRLWIARKQAGLGQKVVAKLLGHRSRSVVSEYETGRLLPSLRTALKLAKIYNTPINELYPALCSEAGAEVDAIQRLLPSVRTVHVPYGPALTIER